MTSPRVASSPPPSVAALTSSMSNTSISGRRGANKSPPPQVTPPPPPPPPPPPSYGLGQAEVLYDYKANDEGDLNIYAGQRITILEYGMGSPVIQS